MILVKKLIKKTLFCSFLFISSSALSTPPHVSTGLKEYEATYQLNWHGIDVGLSIHQLRKVGADRYTAQSISKPHVAVLPFRNNEKSEFILKDNAQIEPQRYEFQNEEKGKTTRGTLYFDWKNKKLTKKIQSVGERVETLPDNAHDRITYTLQLRQDLKNKKQPFNYTVMEPKKDKTYQFTVVGEEKINTPIGQIDTLKLEHVSENQERRTIMWLAKDMDFLMVKLNQFRKGKLDAEASLKKLKVIKHGQNFDNN